jgi:hypothetical protein
LAHKFVNDAREVVKTGDIVKVKVLEVDAARKRISLTMKLDAHARTRVMVPGTTGSRARRGGSVRHSNRLLRRHPRPWPVPLPSCRACENDLMTALRLYAGPTARKHIEQNGLRPQDIDVVPGAAGGPKGLVLGPLDRFIFGDWLPRSSQPVHLVGASIGAWRMATACLDQPVQAFERLEREYIAQDYRPEPGRKRPSAAHISERFGAGLADFYGGRIAQVLEHPRYRLHIVTSRGRHLLGREHRMRTPLGYLGAFLTNTVHRKSMGAWLERVVFSWPPWWRGGGLALCHRPTTARARWP